MSRDETPRSVRCNMQTTLTARHHRGHCCQTGSAWRRGPKIKPKEGESCPGTSSILGLVNFESTISKLETARRRTLDPTKSKSYPFATHISFYRIGNTSSPYRFAYLSIKAEQSQFVAMTEEVLETISEGKHRAAEMIRTVVIDAKRSAAGIPVRGNNFTLKGPLKGRHGTVIS